MAKNFLKFGVWNIEGLSGKLNDTDFIANITKFDIISLVETSPGYRTIIQTLISLVFTVFQNVASDYHKNHVDFNARTLDDFITLKSLLQLKNVVQKIYMLTLMGDLDWNYVLVII